jgi:hypothetical protein
MSEWERIVENILKENDITLTESIIKVYGKNNELIRILKNPSYNDYKNFKKNTKYNSVRGIYGDDGNTYVWDADYGIHHQIWKYLYEAGIDILMFVRWEDFENTLVFKGYSDDPKFTQLFVDRPEEFKIADTVEKAFTEISKKGKITLNSEEEAKQLYKWILDSDTFSNDNWDLHLNGKIITGDR